MEIHLGEMSQPVWIFRGKDGKWESVDWPKQENSICLVAHTLNGKVVFGSNEFSDENVWTFNFKILGLNGEWIQPFSQSPLLSHDLVQMGISYVWEDKIHIPLANEQGEMDLSLIFDPNEDSWSTGTLGITYTVAGVSPFATLNGDLFGVFSVKNGFLAMRFDQTREFWVYVSAIPTMSDVWKQCIYEMEAIDDSLYLIEHKFVQRKDGAEAMHDSSYPLHILKISKNVSGNVGGTWEVVGTKIDDFLTCSCVIEI